MKAAYVRNIAANPRVRLKLRHGILARWHTGTAQVLPDDDVRERQRWLAGRRPSTAVNTAADCLGRTCSRCGLIWMGDAHLSPAMTSSERDLMIDRTLSVSSIRKFLKLWAFGAG